MRWISRVGRGQSKQGKQKGKRVAHRSKREQPGLEHKLNSHWTHVDEEEEELIVQLRKEGLTTLDLSHKLGRSTRTINNVLRKHGMNERQEPTRRKRGGRLEEGQGEGRPPQRSTPHDFRQIILGRLLGANLEAFESYFEEHPEILEAALYQAMGLRAPRHTFEGDMDSWLLREGEENPAFRKRIVDWKLEQMVRGGRTEMDIFGEGMEKFLRFVELMQDIASRWPQHSWPKAFEELAKTGELSNIVAQIVTAKRRGANVPQLESTPAQNQNKKPGKRSELLRRISEPLPPFHDKAMPTVVPTPDAPRDDETPSSKEETSERNGSNGEGQFAESDYGNPDFDRLV